MAARRKLSSEERADATRLNKAWRKYKEDHPHATQEWVSRQCGWRTQGAFYQYVAGLIPLNLQAALKICGALETPLSEISPRLASLVPIHAIAETRGHYGGFERWIPLLDAQQAAAPEQQSTQPSDDSIGIDAAFAASCGPHTFAFAVTDRAMHPEFREGDLVIVDPALAPQPGDVVIAKIDIEPEAILRKYRMRTPGSRKTKAALELMPLNEDFAITPLDAEHPGRIIGPVIEHRRRLKRGS